MFSISPASRPGFSLSGPNLILGVADATSQQSETCRWLAYSTVPIGIERSPRLKSRTGLIVSINPTGTSFRVLIDGRKLPVTLHQSYVEPDEEEAPLQRG
jgi:hypothetical protein